MNKHPVAAAGRTVGLPATLALTALTAVTAVGLRSVFTDWAYLGPMLVVGVGLHLIAALLRLLKTPLWAALPVMMLTALELLAIAYYPGSLGGPFATRHTLELLGDDLAFVLDQFATAVAPVPSGESFAPVTAAALGLCAVIADTFAFRALGRVESVIPTGALFIFTAALDDHQHRILAAAAWVAVALLAVVLLRFAAEGAEATWMGARRLTLVAALPAIALTVGITTVAASAVSPHLPGAGEDPLLDTRNGKSSVTEVLSPLVDIRAQLVDRGNRELFTVDSSAGGHYWRMIGLPEFDGAQWTPPDEDLEKMGSQVAKVVVAGEEVVQYLVIDSTGGPLVEVVVAGEEVVQHVVISSMGGPLVPAAYQPAQVSTDNVLWASDSDSLVLSGRDLREGDEIDIVSIVPNPTPDLLRSATANNPPSSIYLQLPDGMPETVGNIAAEVTVGAATPFDQALALQDWFRDEFTYDIDVRLDNSADAIEAFLNERRGFCQQFAGTFAAMARTLNLPSRVAVGFTPGDLGSDGLYHVYGRHAHAWPEVWFDGVGWIAFEPTPGRGSSDSQPYNGVEPSQDDTGTRGDTTGAPATNTIIPDDGVGSPTDFAGADEPPTTSALPPDPWASGGSRGGQRHLSLVLVALAALGLGWVVALPRVVASLARRRLAEAADRVIAAWHGACNALQLAGAPPLAGSTPLEYATIAERATGVDRSVIGELADKVTDVVYGNTPIDQEVATRCELLGTEVAEMCYEHMSISTRVRLVVDPRLMRRVIAG